MKNDLFVCGDYLMFFVSNIPLTSTKQHFLEHGCVVFVFKPGELFTQEEMDEMLTALADHEKDLIYYKDILSQLTIDPEL